MTREEFLRTKITSLGTIKDFSIRIDMPYSTLQSILKNVGGAAIDNVFKICRGLNISADDLNIFEKEKIFYTTDTEKSMIKKYRQLSSDGQIDVNEYIDFRLQKERSRLKESKETS